MYQVGLSLRDCLEMHRQQNIELCHFRVCESYIRITMTVFVTQASKLHLIKQDTNPTCSQQLTVIRMKQQKFTDDERNFKAKKGQLLKRTTGY